MVPLSLLQSNSLVKPWNKHQEQAVTQCELLIGGLENPFNRDLLKKLWIYRKNSKPDKRDLHEDHDMNPVVKQSLVSDWVELLKKKTIFVWGINYIV